MTDLRKKWPPAVPWDGHTIPFLCSLIDSVMRCEGLKNKIHCVCWLRYNLSLWTCRKKAQRGFTLCCLYLFEWICHRQINCDKNVAQFALWTNMAAKAKGREGQWSEFKCLIFIWKPLLLGNFFFSWATEQRYYFCCLSFLSVVGSSPFNKLDIFNKHKK